MFKYTLDNKRYHTLNYYLRNKFNSKVCKISLNAGFTCPNIDGTKGYGGCIYCSKSGSGEFGGNPSKSLVEQFNDVKEVLAKKWPNAKYIAYFQARTNTYAPLLVLKEKYESVLGIDNVIGLDIATRCDAISDDTLDYLEELSKRTFLTIELGLQTTKEETSILINRGHTLKEFDDMVKKLRERKIDVVVHIINGLPYETREMMLETVKYLNKLDIQGIKIHMLSILKDTKLEELYNKKPFKLLTKDEYIEIVCEQLTYLDEKIVIHRLTGDPSIEDLIAPSWLPKKIDVLNGIDKYMSKHDLIQGEKIAK